MGIRTHGPGDEGLHMADNDNETPRFPHTPVMLQRIVDLFTPTLEGPGKVVVDATLGMGGHSEGLLERFPELTLIGLDRDTDALGIAGERLARFGDRVRLVHTVYDGIVDAIEGEVLRRVEDPELLGQRLLRAGQVRLLGRQRVERVGALAEHHADAELGEQQDPERGDGHHGVPDAGSCPALGCGRGDLDQLGAVLTVGARGPRRDDRRVDECEVRAHVSSGSARPRAGARGLLGGWRRVRPRRPARRP
jgi:hypothetical protein